MRVPFLDLAAQYRELQVDLDAAVARVVRDQRFILGPEVEGLEFEVADYLGSQHAVGCASGTDALLLSVRALGLPPGAEVVVPAFTFFATAGAVWNAGLRPAFADVDPRTLNLTAETIEAALTPDTRAVIVVHLYGRMADMDPILALCRERRLVLIEDAAQSFGATGDVAGRRARAGTVGDLGCLSFFPTKILGGFGDGGMVVTDDPVLADRVAKLRVHGGRQMYHHEIVGTNSRLDALQAAVLRVKLPHVDRWIAARRALAGSYHDGLRGTDVALPPGAPSRDPRTGATRGGAEGAGAGHGDAFNIYTVRVPGRDRVRARLASAGIGVAVYYPVPLHLQECFRPLGHGPGAFPVSEEAARAVLSLPMYPEMPAEHVEIVVAALRGAVRGADGRDTD
ncbi:MAG TPA: DegT/DnrJ/EryC1/StrS family aminotransferase [Longimicrobiales bacterium]|nr:DegT/DnrJ/EryC1/StrS family aminotransferase [Longimicrobiales bacterium]